MKRKSFLRGMALVLSLLMLTATLAGCGGGADSGNDGASSANVSVDDLTLPLAEKVTLKGLTNFPAGSESEPNNRTIFKRLEEKTNVHIEWRTIQSDQWADKISLEMSNAKTLPEFVFNAGFSDTDLLK